MAVLTDAELDAAADALIKKYMFDDEPQNDADYDAVKVVAKRRLRNFMAPGANAFVSRSTPVSLMVASQAASLLDSWRNPPAHVLDGSDDS